MADDRASWHGNAFGHCTVECGLREAEPEQAINDIFNPRYGSAREETLMAEGGEQARGPANPPWEDALIIALRDLQWIEKNKRIRDALLDHNHPDHANKNKLRAMVDSAPKPPALLAKFDGHAESASGDVVTSVGQRFFLFEFKSSRAALSSETTKFVFRFLSSASPGLTGGKKFLELSRRGHHLMYPMVASASAADAAKFKGFLPVHQVTLTTRRYYDGVVQHAKEFADQGFYSDKEITASNLLWDEHDLGLKAPEMAAYLGLLAKAHAGDSGKHPMKVVVATEDGFFWPCGDLSQFMELSKYFEASLSKASLDLQKFGEIWSDCYPVVSHFQAEKQDASPSDDDSDDNDAPSPRLDDGYGI